MLHFGVPHGCADNRKVIQRLCSCLVGSQPGTSMHDRLLQRYDYNAQSLSCQNDCSIRNSVTT